MTKIKELRSDVANMYRELNKSLGMDIMDESTSNLHRIDTEIMLRINNKLGDLVEDLNSNKEHEVNSYKVNLDFSEALDKLKEFKEFKECVHIEDYASELMDKAIADAIKLYFNDSKYGGITIPVDSNTFKKLNTLANKDKEVYGSKGEPIRNRISGQVTRVLEYQGIVFLEDKIPEPVQEPSNEYEISFLGEKGCM